MLSDRGWNLSPRLYHFIERKQFFKYYLRKLFNIIKEQFEKVV